jgi:hypothetical protein
MPIFTGCACLGRQAIATGEPVQNQTAEPTCSGPYAPDRCPHCRRRIALDLYERMGMRLLFCVRCQRTWEAPRTHALERRHTGSC